MVNFAFKTILISALLACAFSQAFPAADPSWNEYQVKSCCPKGYVEIYNYCVRCAPPKFFDPIDSKCKPCPPTHTYSNITGRC